MDGSKRRYYTQECLGGEGINRGDVNEVILWYLIPLLFLF